MDSPLEKVLRAAWSVYVLLVSPGCFDVLKMRAVSFAVSGTGKVCVAIL